MPCGPLKFLKYPQQDKSVTNVLAAKRRGGFALGDLLSLAAMSTTHVLSVLVASFC